jgi:hypothetical protein
VETATVVSEYIRQIRAAVSRKIVSDPKKIFQKWVFPKLMLG